MTTLQITAASKLFISNMCPDCKGSGTMPGGRKWSCSKCGGSGATQQSVTVGELVAAIALILEAAKPAPRKSEGPAWNEHPIEWDDVMPSRWQI